MLERIVAGHLLDSNATKRYEAIEDATTAALAVIKTKEELVSKIKSAAAHQSKVAIAEVIALFGLASIFYFSEMRTGVGAGRLRLS